MAAFEAARARGERPPLPVYREEGAETPPTRVLDGIIAAGGAQLFEADLFFNLVLFYNRLESAGQRYLRYNEFTPSLFGRRVSRARRGARQAARRT